ncbi:MAG: spore protease YyaC [Eubacteriaceae bacterium]|jgi:putative sporulation protein YyaC|nr:spore protease YyaC [Eubacteriaceae bacterium]
MDKHTALLLPKSRFGDNAFESNFAAAVASSLKAPFAVLCVGSDRRLADCFGPILGSLLAEATRQEVYGTLSKPVHKENLLFTLDRIRSSCPSAMVITVDAASSSDRPLGDILFSESGVRAASAIGPFGMPAGDVSLLGVTDAPSAMFPATGAIRLIELYEMANAALRVLSEAFALTARAHA